MKLIITTEHPEFSFCSVNITELGQLLVSFRYRDEKLVDESASGMGRDVFRPFGIAQDTNRIFIASHGKIVSFKKTKVLHLSEINGHLSKQILSDWFPNTHQILYDEGHLYLTGTSVNCIAKFNLETKEINYFDTFDLVKINRPNDPVDVHQHDITHTNSLLINGSSLWFLNHNRGQPSKIIELNKNNFEILNIYGDVGFDAHNLVLHNNFIYYLSTYERFLKSINLVTREIKILQSFDDSFFLRGLCMKENILYIGATYIEETKDRTRQDCYVYTYDLNTMGTTKIKMPFVGSILDLQENI